MILQQLSPHWQKLKVAGTISSKSYNNNLYTTAGLHIKEHMHQKIRKFTKIKQSTKCVVNQELTVTELVIVTIINSIDS